MKFTTRFIVCIAVAVISELAIHYIGMKFMVTWLSMMVVLMLFDEK